MHAGLHINDIRLEICKALALDVYCGRRSLAVLAQTCSVFRDPALDVLWARLDKPAALYMLFPPDIIQIVECEMHYYFACTRPLVAGDWDRFNFYSHRIRYLSLYGTPPKLNTGVKRSETMGKGVDNPSLFEAIDEYRPSSPILPNLQQLVLRPNCERIPAIFITSLLGGDRLQVLKLTLSRFKSESPEQDMLSQARKYCHCLRELSIWGGDHSYSHSLSALVASNPHLQTLSANEIPLTLDTISCLQHIRSLDLKVIMMDSSPTLPFSHLLDNTFFMLRELTLDIDPNLSLDLLENSVLSSLEACSLTGCWTSSTLMSRHLSALRQSRFLSRIEIIDDSDATDELVSPDSISADILRTLFPLPDLAYLTIRCVWFMGLDSHLLRDIGEAWPHLKVLDLLPEGDHGPSHNPTKISLQDIVLFATSTCPWTQQIALNIEAFIDVNSRHQDDPQNNNHNLTHLQVGFRSEDNDAPNFLLEVFPKLRHCPRFVSGGWSGFQVKKELQKRMAAYLGTARKDTHKANAYPPILL